ncbi:hypothetical protein ES703_47908 [subsurface metagenome]
MFFGREVFIKKKLSLIVSRWLNIEVFPLTIDSSMKPFTNLLFSLVA